MFLLLGDLSIWIPEKVIVFAVERRKQECTFYRAENLSEAGREAMAHAKRGAASEEWVGQRSRMTVGVP